MKKISGIMRIYYNITALYVMENDFISVVSNLAISGLEPTM